MALKASHIVYVAMAAGLELCAMPALAAPAGASAPVTGVNTIGELTIGELTIGESGMGESSQVTEGRLEAHLSVNQVNSDGSLQVLLQVINVSDGPQVMHFTSGMGADLHLLDAAGKSVWAWSQEMMFTQALRNQMLEAKSTEDYHFVVPEQAVLNCKTPCSLMARFMGTSSSAAPLLPELRLALK
ncbi:hypothetical protein KJI95_13515 [Shewanella sp. JM162201]|uniref:Intracellular proteinase inhibitor BsuPI domain-containing protein n=1 Tax=Shewanella jiangmenensis TaxID=2837387 RepID=A0ABS5V6J6_9GAMM|nr:BsuPI-related putative proteinase inhibitor [Shewanella jiangmenensis]MBT1445535.1 hypothetical protein [Shewanella jiangmenensis]